MSYLNFDKNEIVNLEYSLNKEIVRSNRAGSYCSYTIVGCNTRKYHGLLVCPLEQIDGEKHVLLSSLDATIVQREEEFNLGIHKYANDYNPKGHKYIRNFEIDKISKVTYRVGGVILIKETTFITTDEEQIIIKYTLEDAHSPTVMRFRPFLAFRNFHQLSKANMDANTKVEKVKNGIKAKLYNGYPFLYMQFSKQNEFISVPDWYYNIEYDEERQRGYDYCEDLFVPGYFEMPIEKGESLYFSASLKLQDSTLLSKKFSNEIKGRQFRDSYSNCLQNAAQQFIVKRDKKTEIIAGYPWFGSWGRDTFIALPGLTLALNNEKDCKAVLDTQISKLNAGLFPNMGNDSNPAFNSVDAPLWFFWTLQRYAEFTKDPLDVWKRYSNAMKDILNGYKNGLAFNIQMRDNYLIWSGELGKSLTWMDAVIYGKPVTPRMGFDVEINALWYNAIVFSIELAKLSKDLKFIKEWKDFPEKIRDSFIQTFWDEQRGYLADYVNGGYRDWSVRPNQIIATFVDYSPIPDEIKKAVLDVVENELLTPRGLRTLSPNDEHYRGTYDGDQQSRDSAYHQGTVWPWLLYPFCESYMKLHKKNGLPMIENLYKGFEPVMMEAGVGTISEIYDGDPPHNPRGAISQAWSVASIINIGHLIEKYS